MLNDPDSEECKHVWPFGPERTPPQPTHLSREYQPAVAAEEIVVVGGGEGSVDVTSAA